jgi:hypothetical protein
MVYSPDSKRTIRRGKRKEALRNRIIPFWKKNTVPVKEKKDGIIISSPVLKL